MLLMSCVGFSATAEETGLTPAEQYAAYVDSLDWPSYDNHIDMVNAAQIPTHILNQMSTEDLVEAFLLYPLRYDLIVWNSYRQGFDAVKSQFNGLEELVNREDGAQKLLEKMQSIPVVMSTANIDHEQYMRPLYLDVLLAQPEFMNQLSEQEIENAIEVVDEIIEQRDPEIYGQYTMKFYDAANEQISLYYNYITIKTPGGKDVSVRAWTPGDPEFPNDTAAREDMVEQQKTYPNALYLSPSSQKYNCHSYAWYSQSINNTYWIGDPTPYLKDGTVRQIGGYKLNTKVMYYTGNSSYDGGPYSHSAIANETSPRMVISKWGIGPLVKHAPDYCPYTTGLKSYEYWNKA